jgi:hypothetical protein
MNTLEQIEALAAGELGKLIGQQFQLVGKAPFTVEDLRNAAKVEVTKGVLPVIEKALFDARGKLHPDIDMTPYTEALTLASKLKAAL